MNHEEYERAASRWTRLEPEAKRMPENELRQEIDDFLASHNTCALATGSGDFVRCTPLEYTYRDGCFWIFSEGGLKFKGLEHNKNVSLAVYEPYGGFGGLRSVQVTGMAQVVDGDAPEFAEAAKERGIGGAALDRVRNALHLIKVVPTRIDYLSSDLKARGYSVRQWMELA